MLKGLTLLEIVIVMAIVASLMLTGSLFLLKYQTSVNLQSAYTYTLSAIKTMQNKATNSTSLTISGSRITPDVVALRFNNNQMSTYYCNFPGTIPGSIIRCSNYATSGITGIDASYHVEITSDCSGIGFGRLTSDLSRLDTTVFTGLGLYITDSPSTPICTITLTQAESRDTRTIKVDINKNSIEL